MAKKSFETIDQYLSAQPEAARDVLARVRAAIGKALPRAEEAISYQMPAFKLDGNVVLYLAGWKQHYSLYPAGERLVKAFGDELARYKVHKATIRFPLAEPVPEKLIARIAKFRMKELVETNKK